MKLSRQIVLSFFALTISLSAFASGSISRFEQVTDGIFRGGRPSASELAQIRSADGIRTDIDLENNDYFVKDEEKASASLGIKFDSSPMSWEVTPQDQQVDTILATMKDTANYPIFIHCFHGEDRTGLMVGLYRVTVQGWTPDKAYQEMIQNGFQRFPALDNYFRQKTGYRGN